ncbi:MAG: hypothetical protein PVI21_02215 [Candidatus Woesebacteria bacterium]|jgi:hypothetical protein
MAFLPYISLNEIPQALWVVASGVSKLGVAPCDSEHPFAYNIGYQNPLNNAQAQSLMYYLLSLPCVSGFKECDPFNPGDAIPGLFDVRVRMDNPDCAQQVFEVIVTDPSQNRWSISEIKRIVRPDCLYTALVVHSAQKLAGNTGLLWIVVRDILTSVERDRLLRQLPKLHAVHSATLRGESIFELRVDYRAVKDVNLMTSRLAVLGIFPDFRAEIGGTVYQSTM